MLERFEEKAYENLAMDRDDELVYLAPTRVNLALTRSVRPTSASWQSVSYDPVQGLAKTHENPKKAQRLGSTA